MRISPLRARQACAVSALAVASACAGRPSPPPSAAPARASSRASHHRSDAGQRTALGLTVYNSNFALVRERRQVPLGIGRMALEFADVAAHIQPATVVVQGLEAPDALKVLDQNYRYDLLSPQSLLQKYVGRTIQVGRLGSEQLRRAEVLATVNGPVLRIEGEVVTGDWTRFIFPALPDSLLARPSLVWLLESKRASQTLEVSYITENVSWSADYVLSLGPSEARGDLKGWITLDNQSGASFHGAQLDLVAGDVQRAPEPERDEDMATSPADLSTEEAAQFRERQLFEYHQYSLGRSTDVLDREKKQVSLFDAPGIEVQKKLRFAGLAEAFRAPFIGPVGAEKVSVLLLLQNSADKGLGMPLPEGVVRIYQADARGAAQFVGEDAIEHTPRDEEIELELGHAFDVIAERRQVAYRALGKCSGESDWAIELRNHKDRDVSVEVIEPADASYEVQRSSLPVKTVDALEFLFDVPVPARSTQTLTYTVRVRWC